MDTLIIIFAKYVLLLPVIFFVWQFYILDKTNKRKIFWLSLCIFPIAYIFAKLGSHLYMDPRPFVTSGIPPLIPHAADNGFPSDHMLLASSIASVLYIFNKKRGIVLFIVALTIGFARVFAGVHHIKDILGSLLIAIFVTIIVYTLYNIWIQKKPSGLEQ